MKPPAYQRKVADRFIAVIRAFKQGKTIQRKQRYGYNKNQWVDVDMWGLMNPKDAVKYRIRP